MIIDWPINCFSYHWCPSVVKSQCLFSLYISGRLSMHMHLHLRVSCILYAEKRYWETVKDQQEWGLTFLNMLSCLIRLKNCMNLQLKSQKLQKWINVQSVEESEHIIRLWSFLTWCQSRSRQISVTCLLHIHWDQVPNIPENILGSFACAVKDKMWIL